MDYDKIAKYIETIKYDPGTLRDANAYVYGNNSLNAKELFIQRKKYQQTHPDTGQTIGGEKLDEFFTYLETETELQRPVPINFWESNNGGYGRYDTNKNNIYPKQFYLNQVGNSGLDGEEVYVLCFVADAFEDMMKYIKIEKRPFLIDDGFLTQNMKAVRGLQRLESKHEKILEAHYNSFKTMLLSNKEINSRVVDFGTFLDSFLNLYGSNALKEYPITKTGLLQSNKIGPNVSGLCIELSKAPHDKDLEKKEVYLNSPNYSFYSTAAAQFGFLVDKNAPWRLVANIYSPKMKPYIQKYFRNYSNDGYTDINLGHKHYYGGFNDHLIENSSEPKKSILTKLTANVVGPDEPQVKDHKHVITEDGELSIETAHQLEVGGNLISSFVPDHTHGMSGAYESLDWSFSDVYKKFFNSSNDTDVNEVKETLINLYKRFVNDSPTVNVPVVCYDKNGYVSGMSGVKTVFKEIKRQPFKTEDYGNLFFIKTYLILRLSEMGKGDLINHNELDEIMCDINQLYYYVDKNASLVYCNNYLKNFL